MVLLGMDKLELWASSFFQFFSAELFTVGSVTFSLLDVFLGAVKLSITGYALGCFIFKIKDKR